MVGLTAEIFHPREGIVPVPTAAQFRAARAMLGWSLVEVARAAQVSVSTVLNVEGRCGRLCSVGSARAVQAALEKTGMRFLAEQGKGVGLRFDPS